MTELISKIKSWPIAGSFRIAHGIVTDIQVVEVVITHNGYSGRGECRPYARYNETSASVTDQIAGIAPELCQMPDIARLQSLLPAGAARNAVDCALWDLAAKTQNKPVWEVLGVPLPRPRVTAFTLSIDSPSKMVKAAIKAKQYPVLKLKIDGLLGLQSCQSVMHARPDAQLIIDANESLSPSELKKFRSELSGYPVLMIEQPVKAQQFDKIENTPDRLPILCADESLHTSDDLQRLWDAGYRAVNVKLDKCGGVSQALETMKTARRMGFVIMAGCMVGTSLAMAPMMVLSSYADVLDLDGPLLLEKDVRHGLHYEGPIIHPPKSKLWG